MLGGLHYGQGKSLDLQFSIDDPRFAPMDPDLVIPSEGDEQSVFEIGPDTREELTIRLDAPRTLEGTVIRADTKEPVAGAWLSVAFCNLNLPADTQFAGIWTKTDEGGRFRVRGRPREYCSVFVYPPVGLPYPAWGQSVKWPAHAGHHEVTIPIPRGILLRGKIVEERSGIGVAGAGVEYQVRRQKTSYYDKVFASRIYWASEYRQILTSDDGTFRMAVAPGVGYLLVKGPTPEFVSRYITHGELQYEGPGGLWYVLEALAKIDPRPEKETLELTVPLRRGVTVCGCVVDPEKRPVARAILITPAYPRLGFRYASTTAWTRPVINGKFDVDGCDPNEPRSVYFLDVEHQWGAAVRLDASGKPQESPTIGLLPCGSATATLRDPQGKPYSNTRVPMYVYLMIQKGQASSAYPSREHLDWAMEILDQRRYRDLQTDAEGRITFPTLIPGAPYIVRLLDEPITAKNQKDKELDFTVRPSETTDLGTIILKRP